MPSLRSYPRVLRLAAIVVGGATVTACMSWHVESLKPQRFTTADSTQTIRVHLAGADTLTLLGPMVVGDSLIGLLSRPNVPLDSLERVSLSLTSIDHIEVQKPDYGSAVLAGVLRSEEHTSELQSPCNLVCRLLLEKKKLYIGYVKHYRYKNQRRNGGAAGG